MATEERTPDGGKRAGSGGTQSDQVASGWRRLMANQWMVALVGGLIVTVGGGLLVAFLTTSHKPSASLAKPILPAGYYVDGGPGTPHYFLLVSKSHGAAVSGTLGFLGQDGQTGLTQPFTGRVSDGLVTFSFSKAGNRTATFDTGSTPASLDLGACLNYLHLNQSVTQCTFNHASNVQGSGS